MLTEVAEDEGTQNRRPERLRNSQRGAPDRTARLVDARIPGGSRAPIVLASQHQSKL